MYSEKFQQSLAAVEAAREKNIALEPERMTAKQKEDLLAAYHPDYKQGEFTELTIGANKGEKVPHELAALLQGNSRIKGMKFDLKHPDYDVDVLIAPTLKSRKVKLVHKVTGKGVEMDFNGFSALGVWTPPKKQAPFVCLEPWNGLPANIGETGNFEDKPYAITLPAGAEYAVSYTVKVIE